MAYHFPGIPPYIDKAAADLKLARPPHRIGGQTAVRSVASRLSQIADMPQASKEDALAEARVDVAELEVAVAACKAAIAEVESELVAPGRGETKKPRKERAAAQDVDREADDDDKIGKRHDASK